MRKGLVVTLGVALVLSVAPVYAEAPLLSCIPDIIVTDLDQGAQTADTNMFIFTNALNLDEYVTDKDTTDDNVRWSFIETDAVKAIAINGIGSNTSGNVKEPGAFDLRVGQANGLIDVENVLWSGTAGTSASLIRDVEVIASDGTSTQSQTVRITTINNVGETNPTSDSLVPHVFSSFTFDAGDEGWTWFDVASVYPAPSHQATGGGLQMTEAAGTTPIAYGGWESPKNPSTGIHLSLGCIARARYTLKTTGVTAPEDTPSFRLRCSIRHMVADAAAPGGWRPKFDNPDFLDDYYMFYGTFDAKATIFANRVPGTAGQTYAALVYPQQVADTLLANDTVAYFAADVLDLYAAFNSDAGTINVDSVEVDGIDRPEIGQGTAVTALSFPADGWTGANWNTGITQLTGLGYTPNVTGLTISVAANGITLVVQPGNQAFEAYAELKAANSVALDSGKYYRLAWTLTSTEQATGDAGPLVRTGIESSELVFSVEKQLDGGSLLARLSSTPAPYEMWFEAPAQVGTTGQTEVMLPRLSSWLVTGNVYPFFRAVSGTVRALSLTTEVFDPSYWQ